MHVTFLEVVSGCVARDPDPSVAPRGSVWHQCQLQLMLTVGSFPRTLDEVSYYFLSGFVSILQGGCTSGKAQSFVGLS